MTVHHDALSSLTKLDRWPSCRVPQLWFYPPPPYSLSLCAVTNLPRERIWWHQSPPPRRRASFWAGLFQPGGPWGSWPLFWLGHFWVYVVLGASVTSLCLSFRVCKSVITAYFFNDIIHGGLFRWCRLCPMPKPGCPGLSQVVLWPRHSISEASFALNTGAILTMCYLGILPMPVLYLLLDQTSTSDSCWEGWEVHIPERKHPK